MNSVSAIALSGLGAATLRLDVAAHNIANAQTPGFRPQAVRQSADPAGGVTTAVGPAGAGGVDLAHEVVDQLVATYSFAANLRVVTTERAMMGTLLDEKA
jgi:flagellar hook protein FlgE